MKGISKRIYALLVTVCMMLTLLPSAAYAETDWSDGETINSGEYNLNGAIITISGTLTINGAVTIKNGTINRGSGFTGAMFSVGEGKSLTLESVTVDGGAKWEGNTDSVLERGTTNSGITASGPIIDAGGQQEPGGTVVLDYGTVLKNNHINSSAGDGGAITIGENGSLTIDEGVTICNNANMTTGNGNSGAIKAYAGANITMNGGEIYGNQAYKHGGAIQIFGGDSTDYERVTFTMAGGTIRNNKAGGVGGGIAVSAYADFIMTDGSITGNSCGSSGKGGGVAFSEYETNYITMSVSGNASITGNKKGNTDNNLEIGTANKLKVAGALTGSIGITRTSNKTTVFTEGSEDVNPADYKDKFTSDNTSYVVVPDGNNLKLAPKSSTYTITVSASPTGGGTVTGGGTYEDGESVTLVATPAEGYRLVGWKEADTQVSTDNPYTFTANADRSLVAVFELKEYEVTVSADPAEGGTVSGGGTYKHGDTATLTASANTSYQFVEWQENGQQVSTDTTYTFAVESVRSLVAVFRKVTYGVDITADPTAGGSVSGGGTYEHGTSVTVTATPAEGYSFVRWTENGSMVSTAASYTFTAEAARSLVAVFELKEYEVTVSADPADGGTVTGGGTYKHGDIATLTANANTSYQFVEWQENGQQVSTDTTYTFAVESVRSLVAVFRKVTYGVDITANPTAGGSVSGGGSYEHGASVTVTATPAEGYSFVRWTENGSTVSTAASYTFTAEAARSLVAEFTERVVFTSPATDQVVTVTAGQPATFETTAENANFYEWYVDKGDGNGFVIIDNTDSSSYTTPPVTLENDGWVYRCRGVNDASFVYSPTFTLQVNADPDDTIPTVSASSGIDVEYLGGNRFSTSRSDVPTSVEIDGVPVGFSGSGRELIVSGIPANARWITIRWNSTSVTTNFTHDGPYLDIQLPKTGDVSVVGYALMAVIAAAGAMLKK